MANVATNRILASMTTRQPAVPEMSTWRYVIAFVLPLTSLIRIELVGTLFLHDILTPIILFALLVGSRTQTSLRPLRTALVLLLIWLFGAVLTDLVRESAFEDYSRGWSRIIFLGMNMVMLWLLSRGRVGVLAVYMAASGLQMVLLTWTTDQAIIIDEPWKFGGGAGLAFLGMAIGAWAPIGPFFRKYSTIGALSVLAALSLFYNARSLFAILALATAYLGLATLAAGNPAIGKRISGLGFAVIALAGLAATQILTSVYAYAASSGLLGQAALRKYLDQSQADLGILLSARPESLVSVQAIMDSPFIGHGSWARDPYYAVMYVERLREVGLFADIRYVQTSGALIPSHSHLLGAWVEAGVAGVPFWIWAAAISVMALFYVLKSDRAPSGMVILTAFILLWDVLFSPFGAEARFHKAGQICLLLSALQYLRPAVAKRVVRYAPVVARRRSGIPLRR